MKSTIRRAVVTLAAAAVAGTGALVTAPAANASAGSCLDRLDNGAIDMPVVVAAGPTVRMAVTTSTYARPLCDGMAVSIAVSRTDGSDLRNANASRARWESNAYFFYRYATFGVRDTGDWMVRQIAVKDRAGRLAVRSFTVARTPDRFTVKRASVLESRQHGSLVPDAVGRITVNGHLKAFNSKGGLSPLAPGQRVLLQVRPRGTASYTTIANHGTAPSGWYSHHAKVTGYRGADVRIAFVSPYQTIAPAYTYVGRIA